MLINKCKRFPLIPRILSLWLVWFALSLVSVSGAQANDGENCVSCHQQQVSDWQQSDHAKAMDLANEQTVLGDFNNATTAHYSQSARFFKNDDNYMIELTEAGKTSTYQVIYTFGHYPLQQYLVPAQNGRYQVFPFSWDSRSETEGGQRWYPNYQNEDVQPNDRLHWQQGLQNWNGMCADCHSDGLKRNFDVSSNSFDTKWDEINVGCQSCHGKVAEHGQSKPYQSDALIDSPKLQAEALNWLLEPGEKVARLRNPDSQKATAAQKAERQQFMDTCFACHSLRSPMTDGFSPDKPFLDQFSPSLIAKPLYHSDGQIKEEVYVYGSFLQSKMYAEGVTCLDCHNAHTMKIKSDTNGLCLQCHTAEAYQSVKHTRHDLESEAGQCVTCHMSETTYMGVDARRDHSFKIPRPHLSTAYQTPNACVNCHTEQSNTWAAEKLAAWHGPAKALSRHEQYYLDLIHNESLSLDKHLAVINSKELNEIKRASAIMLLPNSIPMLSEHVVKGWVNSELPLIRLATAKVGHLLSDTEKLQSYQTLLNDKYKSIRVAAANELVGLGLKDSAVFKKAFEELTTSHLASNWRGEGNLNQSLVDLKLGQNQDAITNLKNSIKVDPYFEPAYVNLVDIYRSTKQTKEEVALFKVALERLPTSGTIQYAYGMHLIRMGNKNASVLAFKKAMELQSENPQHAYLYFLALDATGKTGQALKELKQVINQYPTREMIQLGLSLSQKMGDRASFDLFMRKQN